MRQLTIVLHTSRSAAVRLVSDAHKSALGSAPAVTLCRPSVNQPHTPTAGSKQAATVHANHREMSDLRCAWFSIPVFGQHSTTATESRHAIYLSYTRAAVKNEKSRFAVLLMNERLGTAYANWAIVVLMVGLAAVSTALLLTTASGELYGNDFGSSNAFNGLAQQTKISSVIWALGFFSLGRAVGCWMWRFLATKFAPATNMTMVGVGSVAACFGVWFPYTSPIFFSLFGIIYGAKSPVLTGFAFANEWDGDIIKMEQRQMVIILLEGLVTVAIVAAGPGIGDCLKWVLIGVAFCILAATVAVAHLPTGTNSLRLPSLPISAVFCKRYMPFLLMVANTLVLSLFTSGIVWLLVQFEFTLVQGNTSLILWWPFVTLGFSLVFAIAIIQLKVSSPIALVMLATVLVPFTWVAALAFWSRTTLSADTANMYVFLCLGVEGFRSNAVGLLQMRMVPSRWKWASYFSFFEGINALFVSLSPIMVYGIMLWAFENDGGQLLVDTIFQGYYSGGDLQPGKPISAYDRNFMNNRRAAQLGLFSFQLIGPASLVAFLLVLPVIFLYLYKIVFVHFRNGGQGGVTKTGPALADTRPCLGRARFAPRRLRKQESAK